MNWRDVIISRLGELTLFEVVIFRQSNPQLEEYFEDERVLDYLSKRADKKLVSFDDFYDAVI
jgi:hypothetical protein